MKKILEKCDKCHRSIKDVDICDNCGKEIESESMKDVILRIERPMPDGGPEWTFQFCSMKCMTDWMHEREVSKEYELSSPHEWKDETRKKFDISP